MGKKLITGIAALGLGIAGAVGAYVLNRPAPTPTPAEEIRGLAQLVKDKHDTRHDSENGDRYIADKVSFHKTKVYDTPESEGVATIIYNALEYIDQNKNGVVDEGDRLTMSWYDERKPSELKLFYSDDNLDGMKGPITMPGSKGDHRIEYDPSWGKSTAKLIRTLIPEKTSTSDPRLVLTNKNYLSVVRKFTENLSKK